MHEAFLFVTGSIPGIPRRDEIIGNAVPPETRRGFTLIELLIVLVIIGVLAGISIPRYSSAREKAFVSAVMSDLKVMASQMEIYQAENLSYPADIALLTDFVVSKGVTVTINEATAGTGWAATGNHDGIIGSQCGIYYGTGSAANAVPATSPGIVMCQ